MHRAHLLAPHPRFELSGGDVLILVVIQPLKHSVDGHQVCIPRPPQGLEVKGLVHGQLRQRLGQRLVHLLLAELVAGDLAVPVQVQLLEHLLHHLLGVHDRADTRKPLLWPGCTAGARSDLIALIAFRALVVARALRRRAAVFALLPLPGVAAVLHASPGVGVQPESGVAGLALVLRRPARQGPADPALAARPVAAPEGLAAATRRQRKAVGAQVAVLVPGPLHLGAAGLAGAALCALERHAGHVVGQPVSWLALLALVVTAPQRLLEALQALPVLQVFAAEGPAGLEPRELIPRVAPPALAICRALALGRASPALSSRPFTAAIRPALRILVQVKA
mmetsp:Transcript_99987/g.238283  ORF Transcript_99987/g.238283 Transcript_99987/m.238283 type:complete len:337 (-) Transcript_99987:4289-5299(-)